MASSQARRKRVPEGVGTTNIIGPQAVDSIEQSPDPTASRAQEIEFFLIRAELAASSDGVAIVLKERDRFVCCASSGHAPERGVPLEPHHGICGQCLSTGKVIIRQDLDGDIRSVLAVPILRELDVKGLIALFAQRPEAFGSGDIAKISELADSIGVDVDDSTSRGESDAAVPLAAFTAEEAQEEIPAINPDVVLQAEPPQTDEQLPPWITEFLETIAEPAKADPEPLAPEVMSGAVDEEALHSQERFVVAPIAVTPAIEAIQEKAEVVAAPVVNQIPEVKAVETKAPEAKTPELKASPTVIAAASTAAEVQPAETNSVVAPKPAEVKASTKPEIEIGRRETAPKQQKPFVKAASKASWKPVSVAEGVAKLDSSKLESPKPKPTTSAANDSSKKVPAAVLRAAAFRPSAGAIAKGSVLAVVVALGLFGVRSYMKTGNSASNVSAAAVPAPSSTAVPQPTTTASESTTVVPTTTNTTAVEQRRTERQKDIASTKSAVSAPIEVASNETVNRPTTTPDAPSLPLAPAVNGQGITAPIVASTTSNLPILGAVRGGVTRDPILESKVEPQYPPVARSMHLAGTVTLSITVKADGRVGDVRVVSGPTLLADSAVRAVRQWRYQPALLNGKAVQNTVGLKVVFK